MRRIDRLLKMNVLALVVTIVFILLVISAMTLLAQSDELGIGMFIGMMVGWLIIPLGIMVMLVAVGYFLLIYANFISFGKKFESHSKTILLTRMTFFSHIWNLDLALSSFHLPNINVIGYESGRQNDHSGYVQSNVD